MDDEKPYKRNGSPRQHLLLLGGQLQPTASDDEGSGHARKLTSVLGRRYSG